MNWIFPILNGIWQGIFIAVFSFGPAFFTLVNTGISSGKFAGFRMALGIFLSEFAVAMACFFGLSDVFTNYYFQLYFAAIAGTLILLMGLKSYKTKYKFFLKNNAQHISASASFWKGFAVNLLNPFAIMLWIGILATTSLKYNSAIPLDKWRLFANLISILITVFAFDMGKVHLSDFLGRKISKRIYFFVQKYFGLVLMLIGAYFIYHFIDLYLQNRK